MDQAQLASSHTFLPAYAAEQSGDAPTHASHHDGLCRRQPCGAQRLHGGHGPGAHPGGPRDAHGLGRQGPRRYAASAETHCRCRDGGQHHRRRCSRQPQQHNCNDVSTRSGCSAHSQHRFTTSFLQPLPYSLTP